MHYLNISITHKNSSIEVREKLAFTEDEKRKETLKNLCECEVIAEVILIATCNRMEIFCNVQDMKKASKAIFIELQNHSGLSIEELQKHADVFDDSSAIHHLFSVSASLDSMVLGETQIVGQLKDAFRYSLENGFCGKKLTRVMQSAFKSAADVRKMTDISSKPISMASVSVSKLKSLVENIEGKKALIIGVGEMSEITAKHLINLGVDVYIMNRTEAKAEALAHECHAKVVAFHTLKDAINEFDFLFSATSSQEPIIKKEMINECDFKRYWFDLALPRDIECEGSSEIHISTIDDLKSVVDENLAFREEAARSAHSIIGRGVVEFFEWLNLQDVEPMIKNIYVQAMQVAQKESKRAIQKGFIPKEYEDEAKKMCEQTLKTFLHDMTSKMRVASKSSTSNVFSDAMSSLIKAKN